MSIEIMIYINALTWYKRQRGLTMLKSGRDESWAAWILNPWLDEAHISSCACVMMLRMAGWQTGRQAKDPSLLLLGRQTEHELMEPATAISLPQFLWKQGCHYNGRLLCRCSGFLLLARTACCHYGLVSAKCFPETMLEDKYKMYSWQWLVYSA